MGEVKVETIATTRGPRHVDAVRRGGLLIHTPLGCWPDQDEVTVTHAASGKAIVSGVRRAHVDEVTVLLERSGAPWDADERTLILWTKARPWWVEFIVALRGGHLKTAEHTLNKAGIP